jgi:hypothetical protein
MIENTTSHRSRVARGRPYSLAEFADKYGLDDDTALKLFTRFGPSSVELDLLMAAKTRLPSIHTITEDLASEKSSRRPFLSSATGGDDHHRRGKDGRPRPLPR